MNTQNEILQQVIAQAHSAGWTNILAEQTFRSAGTNYQPDLILGYNGYPLAVLEVKTAASGQLQEGLTRSLEYAVGLGIPIALATNGRQGLQQIINSADATPLDRIPTPQQLWGELGRDWSPSDPRLAPLLAPGDPPFRLHQLLAIGHTLDAVMAGSTRLGIAMVQGSGRHFAVHQILVKLINSGYRRRALYLFESSEALEQTLHRLSKAAVDVVAVKQQSDFANPGRIHLCTMHRFLKQCEDQAGFVRSDWYDLIVTQDARQTAYHLSQLNYFAQAVQIASAYAPTEPFFETVFQYTLEDVLTAEEAKPPPGFRSVRLGDVAELRTGVVGSLVSRLSQGNAPKTDFALIAARDLGEEAVMFSQAKRIEAALPDESALRVGDILVSSFFALSRPLIVLLREAPKSSAVHAHSLIRIRVNTQQVKPEEVYAFLMSDAGQRALTHYSSSLKGTLRLTVSALADLRVFLPESTVKAEKQLGAVSRAIYLIKERVLPALERAEQAGPNGSSERSEREIASGFLKQILPELIPPPLSETIINQYPAPIALAFRRFMEARFNPHEQLLRLRDLYESATMFLYYLMLSDWFRNLEPSQFKIEERNTRQAYNGFSMSARIDFVECVVNAARAGLRNELFIPEVADADVIVPARTLQDFRNAISHTSTAAESRQRKIIQQYQPVVESLLRAMGFLAQYRLVKIPLYYFRDGQTFQRIEIYQGTAVQVEEYPLPKESAPVQADHSHLVLLSPDSDVLDLHPFYQLIANEATRDEQHLCFLKQRKAGAKVLQGESITGAFELDLDGFESFEKLIESKALPTTKSS